MIKDKYESYRQALLAGGADPKEVDRAVSEARAETIPGHAPAVSSSPLLDRLSRLEKIEEIAWAVVEAINPAMRSLAIESLSDALRRKTT